MLGEEIYVESEYSETVQNLFFFFLFFFRVQSVLIIGRYTPA
jgi:hypothetical protein